VIKSAQHEEEDLPIAICRYFAVCHYATNQKQINEENNKHAVHGIQMPHDFKHVILKD